jgi:hypothetical protein
VKFSHVTVDIKSEAECALRIQGCSYHFFLEPTSCIFFCFPNRLSVFSY